MGVVPGHHELVDLDDGVGADAGPLVHPVAVGDQRVQPVGVELPAVERAHQVGPVDVASVAEVGAQVGAERVVEVGLALFVAPAGARWRPK